MIEVEKVAVAAIFMMVNLNLGFDEFCRKMELIPSVGPNPPDLIWALC
jgi:hypothetical protein